MGRGSTLYATLPVPLQNLAVTGYGVLLYRRRYGREHRRWLAYLLASQWKDQETTQREQLVALQRMVDYAFLHVPYYREAYSRVGYKAGDITRLEHVAQLPIVEKDDVRRDPKSFVSDEYRPESLYKGHTSGTSGKPLTTFKDRDAYQRNWAFQERVRSWFGIQHRSRRVVLNARPVVPSGQTSPPFWRHDLFTHNWVFSVFHLSRGNLPAYVRALVDIQPAEIHGYPSAVVEVARAVLESGETRIRPRAVITSSETLLASQRDVIEGAFGCRVRDQYGCAENVAWISQCEHGCYHVHPEYGYVETVQEGKVVSAGTGEVVGTGFINRAMPLVRYRVGDTLTMDAVARCACGRSFPIVREVLGRTEDVLYSPDGRPLGRLDPLFKGLEAVAEGQFVQDELDHLIVRLVAAAPLADDVVTLRGRIRDAFGPAMRVTFEEVESIPRNAAGKFSFTINLVKKQAIQVSR